MDNFLENYKITLGAGIAIATMIISASFFFSTNKFTESQNGLAILELAENDKQIVKLIHDDRALLYKELRAINEKLGELTGELKRLK